MKQFNDLSKDEKFFVEDLQKIKQELHSLRNHARAYATSAIATETDKLFCAISCFQKELCYALPYTPVDIVLPTDLQKVVELLQEEIAELKSSFESLIRGYSYLLIPNNQRHQANIRNIFDYLQHILADKITEFNTVKNEQVAPFTPADTEVVTEEVKPEPEVKTTKKSGKVPPSEAK